MKETAGLPRPGPENSLWAAAALGAAVCCLAIIMVQASWMDYARQNREESQAGSDVYADAIDTAIWGAGGGARGEEAARYAVRFLGTPYVWGGDSLTEGVDCSGFVMSVYRHFQVSLPHSAQEDKQAGCEVDGLENARPGDLICYDDPGHVAIYLGEGMIVHATVSGGVCISRADFGEIAAVRRIFEAEQPEDKGD